MPYVGNIPAEKYAAFNVQYFTTSATDTYTLDRAVANELDIRLVINNVIQEPGSGKAYTAAGTTLTLSAATAGSDTMYCVYIGKAVQTVNPGAGSVGTTALADNAVTLGKMASGTDGNIISYDASGNPVAVATGSSGQVLTSAGAGAPPTFAAASGTTINTNADNRVITGSGTANTLNGEANLTYSSPNLTVTGGNPSIIHNNTTSGGDTGIKFQGSGVDYGFLNLDNSDGALDLGTVVNWPIRFFSNNAETFNQNTSTTKFNYAGTHNLRSYGWVGNGSGQGWKIQRDSNQGSMLIETSLTSNRTMFSVINGNGTVGTISVNGSATAYNTSSDYRLKENEVAISDGIERLKQLKPYRFNFKADENKTVDGFFAHEVSPVVPEAISGDKDAMHPEVLYTADDELPEGKEIGDVKEATKINPQAIDQSKLVPLLTSALQEAITKIETLETKVTALESA